MRSRKLVILVALLALLGLAWGRTFVLMAAEPNACIQESMSPALVPWTIDPSLIQGSLLPAIPGSQNGWQVPRGKWTRTARACDPEGHPFTIEFVEGPAPATVSYDPAAQTWTVVVENLPVGKHLFVFKATDSPGPDYDGPKTRFVTIAVEGLPSVNEKPVLF